MTKKLMRGLVPVMVLSGSSRPVYRLWLQRGSRRCDQKAGETKGNRSCRIHSSIREQRETESKGPRLLPRIPLIIATANETPSVTTNLHNAVAGDYINQMTHNSLFYLQTRT